tara:strand:- start:86 stop:1090 length:1005 start_codon:yes stop_codon:yes gene_type:complete
MILVTGSAGFIGAAVSNKLLERGEKVIGIDNHNDYYDPVIKDDRLKFLINFSNYKHYQLNIADKKSLENIFENNEIKKVINLAAQAGVRYSMKNPLAYIESNIVGFANILENCRKINVEHLVYASTSSIYGANSKIPFSEHDSANHPLSVYAASKKSNELMSHAYSHLYGLPTTGLRFFTVYGPWGRPDMALFKFTKNILEDKAIDVFNHGNHTRDFTFIDDIVEGILKSLDSPAKKNFNWDSNNPDPATSNAPWRVFNIGNNSPIKLMDYISALEKILKKKAIINFLPLQPGDVPETFANVDNLNKHLNYKPSTSVIDGISKFVNWYLDYYKK